MLIGVLSDTHSDRANALPHIIHELVKRGVKMIIHCGDIEEHHLKPELFANLPVICALNAEQLNLPCFKTPPSDWIFTVPGKRIVNLVELILAYVGHKRSFDFVGASELSFMGKIDQIGKEHDGLRYVFSGHTHHQSYVQTKLVNSINPGAVEDSYDGYAFAIINTDTREIVFSRIMKTQTTITPFSIGVISDSLRISRLDPQFWSRLVTEFKKREVKTIIHCGNIDVRDIGISELNDFDVHVNLRPDQKRPRELPTNWQLIPQTNPIITIGEYQFYVKLDLGIDFLGESEIGMHRTCLEIKRKFPETNFVLCGTTHGQLFVEGESIKIINPGDVENDGNFTVISLPRTEITFGHVPFPALPRLV